MERTLRWSLEFLQNHTTPHCHSSLVILTDSTRKINKTIIEELDPGKTITILTFSFDNTLAQYGDFEDMSCQSGGLFEVIRNIGDYQTAVLQFTEFFQKSSEGERSGPIQPSWSNVYYDQAGSGYVITTTLPVTVNHTIYDPHHEKTMRNETTFMGMLYILKLLFVKQVR